MKDNVKGNKQIFLCTAVPLSPSFTDIDFVKISQKIAQAAGLTALEWQSFYYPEQGSSFHWFLGESHIQIDNYPEFHMTEIILVSCAVFDIIPIVKVIGDNGFIIKQYSILKKDTKNQWNF